MQFNNANIINNAATIVLNGAGSQVVDQNGLDGLRNFATNTAAGSLTIQSGRNLTTPGDFSNAGSVTLGAGSTLATGGVGNYTQVDGSLVAGGGQVNIQGGTLSGTGSITGSLSNAGALSPGDVPAMAGTLNVSGSYVQTSSGFLFEGLGGTTTDLFDRTLVAGSASLDGTLNVSLINGFFPSIGDSFVIMTFASLTGTFATVTGLNIGGGGGLADSL